MDQYLNQLWQKWQRNGALPHAQPLVYKDGWSLTLCFRARVTAWMIFLLFAAGFVGVLLLQKHDPMPQRNFALLLAGYAAFASLAAYYLGFVYWYQVTVDESGIELRRLLIPTRRMAWSDIERFEYAANFETLNFFDREKRKIGLYLSLHGLSAVRRSLVTFGLVRRELEDSWTSCDRLLLDDVPSWRCTDQELRGDPFAPLKSA